MSAIDLRVGIGGYTAQGMPRTAQAGIAQRDIVEHAVLAEELGFDSFWLGEHHFSTDGYTSAIFPMLGALAARTKTLVIGTRVLLAPLHPALLLAEDAAQVALLAPGRFVLGLGIGYRDEEFNALGVPKNERAARLEEIVDVCRKAWRGQPFDHAGPTVQVESLVCRPAPPVPPRLWLGGRAPAALTRAARLADGYVAPLAGAVQAKAAVDELDALTPQHRRPLPITTGAFVLASRDARTARVLDEGVRAAVTQYRSWLSLEPELYSTATDETFGVVRGTPDEVVSALLPRVEAYPDREHHLALRVDYPGMSRQQVEDHIALLANEILPALHDAADAAASPTR